VGIVAHFRDQKDHPTFLRAAREILKGVPSARFQLVGSGVLEPAIRDLAVRLGIAARTEFFGQLDPDAVRAALARFHVSVLTSKNNEGLPNAVLESMAAGRPVVATAVGGIPEVIDDGVTGYLVPPQDPAAVAERVVALLNDPSLAARMGARGRQKVEREFTLAGMVARFHTLYRDSLAETRAQGN
jgi:glycosyltransferase involved in cell wall biosynthesis